MKNDYEIRGETTVIFLRRRDGSRLETLIDTADLGAASSIPGRWGAKWSKKTQSYYVGYNKHGESTFSLHRVIMCFPEGQDIDHLNHDTLDNRRSVNLISGSRSANGLNRRGPNPGNRSGFRGVRWDPSMKRWRTRVELLGKTYHFGSFRDSAEAGRVCALAIEKLLSDVRKGRCAMRN